MAPVRIGFVLHVMQVAGAEMLVAETIRQLGARVDPVVLCLDKVGQLGETMRGEGVDVIELNRQPGFDLGVARRLAREITARRLEVVHAHQYTPFFYSALARLFTRQPIHLIFTEHGRHYPDVVSWQRRTVNAHVLRRMADEVTGVCQFSADSLAANDGFRTTDIRVIENGIRAQRYTEGPGRDVVRASLGLALDRRYVICIARFHPVKDHRMLVDAFATVAAAHPDTDLLLAGDGPLRQKLEQRVMEHGIAGRVRFLGVRSDVPDLLKAADVFALTSVSEAASLTLLEAMASGLPVVVTDVGGNPEIVRQGVDGYLVPRGDAPAAADRIGALLADRALARTMGESGRARVLGRFNLPDTIERYYERYQLAAERMRASSAGRAA